MHHLEMPVHNSNTLQSLLIKDLVPVGPALSGMGGIWMPGKRLADREQA
jgi:hypothetical protein